MKRTLEMGAAARQSFYELGAELQRRVLEKPRWFLDNDVAPEPLEGNLKGLCNLRVGDYRIVYEIESETTIVVRSIRHRSKAYEDLARTDPTVLEALLGCSLTSLSRGSSRLLISTVIKLTPRRDA